MSYALLKKQLKEKDFSSVYLFFGQEEYLKNYYLEKFKNAMIDEVAYDFNYSVFEGKNIDIGRVIDAIEAFPVMSSRKMIVIKNSGIFRSSNAELKNLLEEYIKDLPSYICLIFYEKEIDKRSSLYKLIKKQGTCFDFEYLKTADLVAWIGRMFAEHKKKIDNKDILYLIEHCDTGMASIKNEVDKLIDYCYKKEKVDRTDIQKVCTKSIENRIFDFLDGINEGDAQKAFQTLNDMLILKEPIAKILFLLSKNFSGILKTKLLLKQKKTAKDIAKELKIHPFVAQKYVKYSSGYTIDNLHNIIRECIKTDNNIKTGRLNNEIGLQLFAAKCIRGAQGRF